MADVVPIDFEGVTFTVPRAALSGWVVSDGNLVLGLTNFTGSIAVCKSGPQSLGKSATSASAAATLAAAAELSLAAAGQIDGPARPQCGAGAGPPARHGGSARSRVRSPVAPSVLEGSGGAAAVSATSVPPTSPHAAASMPRPAPPPRKRKAAQHESSPDDPADVIVIDGDASPVPCAVTAHDVQKQPLERSAQGRTVGGGSSKACSSSNTGRAGGIASSSGSSSSSSGGNFGNHGARDGSGGGTACSGAATVKAKSAMSEAVVDCGQQPGHTEQPVLVSRAHSFVVSMATRPRRSRFGKGVQGLRREVASFVGSNHGVARVETTSIASNQPSEDVFCTCEVPVPGAAPILLSMVCDGHGGKLAAEFACSQLPAILGKRVAAQSSTNVRVGMPSSLEDRGGGGDAAPAALSLDVLRELLLASLAECFRASIAPAKSLQRGFCNAGACLAVVLVCGTTALFGNLGDSRAIAAAMRTSAIPSDGEAASDDFFVELTTTQVTFDHIAADASEASLVQHQSGDPHAIRSLPGETLPRVAASLAVTRSFGDFYLKHAEFCPHKSMKVHLPYLLPDPFTASARLLASGGCRSFVVVASDGLWDHLTNDQVAECVSKHLAQQGPIQSGLEVETASEALLYLLMQTIAAKRGRSISQLLQTPQRQRRQLFDDTTISIIFLDGSLACEFSSNLT